MMQKFQWKDRKEVIYAAKRILKQRHTLNLLTLHWGQHEFDVVIVSLQA